MQKVEVPKHFFFPLLARYAAENNKNGLVFERAWELGECAL